ncbi:MAG: thioredoxin family protein [Prevotellaceae bacterium]|nr:thioredoxin family protein [Prevotellaceae bacterium]
MRRGSIMTILLTMWLCATSLAQEQQNGICFHDNKPWKEVLELAQKENKYIFMDCYTSWCGPCKALAKEVFSRADVGAYFNPRFVNVKYDMEKGEGKMLYAKYKSHIVGFPTLLLIDKDGSVVHQFAGFQKPEVLIAGTKNACEGKSLFWLAKQYEQGNRSLDFLKDYIEGLNAAFLRDSAVRVAHAYLNSINPSDLDKEDVWQIMGPYVTEVNTPAFDYLVMNVNRYQRKLYRDRLAINRQLEYSIEKELRACLSLRPKQKGEIPTLCVDTLYMAKLVNYLERIGSNSKDAYQSKLYIHKLLLRGSYKEVWQALLLCRDMRITGYYSTTIHDYIRYLMQVHHDKQAWRVYLRKLEEMQADAREYNYHALETMALLYQRLGKQKQANELMKKYLEIDEEKRKEFEKLLHK